ncbi:NAD(P)-binding protein [Roridomyces roridus]|uniref:NAD(P)-binding protein n=1 Tax=Roridomyces roridus TaxID=1738132 RepID=A0AAD7FFG7_9AGAR|nr:NAD(P)-binding protein [Roridomyces roridus]
MPPYTGRKALVTGAGSGIGEHLAKHLVEHGAKVLCADINEAAGRQVVDQLNEGHPSPVAYFVKADVTNWDSVVNMFTTAASSSVFGGSLDFVFANAGVGVIGFPDKPGPPNIASITVNLIGVVYTMQAAIAHFREFKAGGRILVTASQSSLHPMRAEPLYTASKHGVVGLVRATAMRTAREGIFINAVAPGNTPSKMMSKYSTAMDNLGWSVSKETIVRAFDIFLAPECRYAGQLAEAVGEDVDLWEFPTPTKDRKSKSKL